MRQAMVCMSLGFLSLLTGVMAASPPTKLKCNAWGDPHIEKFFNTSTKKGGEHCVVYGVGVFPFVTLQDYKVQVFHCPPRAGMQYGHGRSMIVATAAKLGNDLVTMIGEEIMGNGVPVPAGGHNKVGKLIVHNYKWRNGAHVEARNEATGTILTAVRIDDNSSSTNYSQNVHADLKMTSPEAMSRKAKGDGTLCGSDCPITLAVPEKDIMFTKDQMEKLMDACGNEFDESLACSAEPSPKAICGSYKQSHTEAERVCKLHCPCGGTHGLTTCITDWCRLGGDDVAGDDCAEEYGCLDPNTAKVSKSSKQGILAA